MRIHLGSEIINTSPENTTLFTFAGRLATYNYVYVENGKQFSHVFEKTKQYAGLYAKLTEEIMQNEYSMHLNNQTVEDSTIAQYNRVSMREAQNIPDTFPIDWLRNN